MLFLALAADSAEDIIPSINLVKGLLNLIANEANQIPNEDIKKQIADNADTIAQIEGQLISSIDILKDGVKADLLEDMINVLTPFDDECVLRRRLLYVIQMIITIGLVLISLLFPLSLFGKKFRYIFNIIAFVLMVSMMITAIVTFVLLALGSDGCIHFKPVVLKYVKSHILTYFFYCPGHHDDPINWYSNGTSLSPEYPKDEYQIDLLLQKSQDIVSQSSQLTQQLQTSFEGISQQLSCMNPASNLENVCKELNQTLIASSSIQDNLGQLSLAITMVIQMVQCPPIYNIINNIFSNVCTDIYESIYLLFINSIFASVCYILLIIFNVHVLN